VICEGLKPESVPRVFEQLVKEGLIGWKQAGVVPRK
jgi:hypothetical protein